MKAKSFAGESAVPFNFHRTNRVKNSLELCIDGQKMDVSKHRTVKNITSAWKMWMFAGPLPFAVVMFSVPSGSDSKNKFSKM